jgi:hypothetical protein
MRSVELTALSDEELETAAAVLLAVLQAPNAEADAARRLAAINSELRERRVLQAAEGRCSTCQ